VREKRRESTKQPNTKGRRNKKEKTSNGARGGGPEAPTVKQSNTKGRRNKKEKTSNGARGGGPEAPTVKQQK
jgi:hypothetical protein